MIPISIDLAIDSHHGNILRDDIWKRLICSRKVTGGHAGPPCETLSFARWLLLEDGQRQQPLRTTQAPWGRDDLSLCLLLIYLQGGSFSLEHPKGQGGQKGRWSIWDSAFVKLLLLAGSIQRTDFLQGPFKQPFPKPTSLLAGRLPDLPHHLHALYQTRWWATERLGGRNRDGKGWRMAHVKSQGLSPKIVPSIGGTCSTHSLKGWMKC